MRNSIILAGAAALALAGPALAQGKGNGGGPKGGGGAPAKVERGGGGPKAQAAGGGMRAERSGGQQQRADRPQVRPTERRAERPQRSERAPVREARGEPPRGQPAKLAQPDRGRPVDRQEVRGRDQRGQDRSDDVRIVSSDRFFRDPRAVQSIRQTGLIDGCPPGLAAKNNGCLPPGQAKKLVGAIVPAALGSALLPPLYRSWYPDNDDYLFRTDNGYVYRIDRDRNFVDGYWPLSDDWSGAYYVGAAYPQDYLGYYNVPAQYRPWYADNDDYYYRYGDGSIYRVDRDGGVIDGIVSLLAGGFGVNQPLPAGYDVYNVPYAYRDRYVDTPDAWYRYNDGYIYQVDPTTRLVQAIVETLV